MLTDSLFIPSTISDLKQVFQGSAHSPFLAPRGVWVTKDKLCVSDTGQNRVFVWDHIPTTIHAEPAVTLGQTSSVETGRNANAEVSASSLQYPSGIWTDGHKLIVADAWNHRVLIWHQFPTTDGQPADTVLGQQNKESNEPNVNGLSSECSDRSLYWPYGVHSDGQQLWIADTGNRRVLYFSSIPTSDFEKADAVIGKPDFTTRDYEPEQPIWPYSVRISAEGKLAITDTQYFRVLLWNDWEQAQGAAPPDQVIGQPDMMSSGQNQYHLAPNAQSLNWCYDSFFCREGLLVMDTANSRIKWHPQLFDTNNPVAEGIFGQENFATSSENVANLEGTDALLYWPFSICVNKQNLVVADTGNHRILINQLLI